MTPTPYTIKVREVLEWLQSKSSTESGYDLVTDEHIDQALQQLERLVLDEVITVKPQEPAYATPDSFRDALQKSGWDDALRCQEANQRAIITNGKE